MNRHSLIELEAVLAIVRCGSFRAAALDLGMSTTAISNAVGKLERELAVRLFDRTTRSVSLTHAGRIFVAQIKPALKGIQKSDEHGALPAGDAVRNLAHQRFRYGRARSWRRSCSAICSAIPRFISTLLAY